mmetsp:Transcript_20187/g.43684  ORF Transcript_20187/g.43684 Transcript_20187/m.43684 type:complete len:298 (+) Transcript_20187:452-1345(+)
MRRRGVHAAAAHARGRRERPLLARGVPGSIERQLADGRRLRTARARLGGRRRGGARQGCRFRRWAPRIHFCRIRVHGQVVGAGQGGATLLRQVGRIPRSIRQSSTEIALNSLLLHRRLLRVDDDRGRVGARHLHRLRHLLPRGLCRPLPRDREPLNCRFRHRLDRLHRRQPPRLHECGARLVTRRRRVHRRHHRHRFSGGLYGAPRPRVYGGGVRVARRQGELRGDGDGRDRRRRRHHHARIVPLHVRLPGHLLFQDGDPHRGHHRLLPSLLSPLLCPALRHRRSHWTHHARDRTAT